MILKRYTRGYIRLLAVPIFISLYLIGMYLITNKQSRPIEQTSSSVVHLQQDVQALVEAPGYLENLLHPIQAFDEIMKQTEFDDDDDDSDQEYDSNLAFFQKQKQEDDKLFVDAIDDFIETAGDDPVLVNASDVLKSTTVDIIHTPRIRFLKDVKNPCFAVNSKMENVGNIEMKYALQEKFDIKCLPHVIVAGFNGCGTDDLLKWITTHRLATTGEAFKQSTTNDVQQHPHFWDNLVNQENYTLNHYVNKYSNETSTIVDGFKQATDYKDLLIIDGTPNTLWFGNDWKLDDVNHLLDEPSLLLPHKIHHVVPQSKIIVILRSPTDRLIEDYITFFKGQKKDEDFKERIFVAIEWWKHCLEDLRLPLRTCAYGKSPHIDLDPLDFESCSYSSDNITLAGEKICEDEVSWTKNSADRLRVGLYYIFLQDWIKIFPKEQFLFIKFEDYVTYPYHTIEKKVLPFLGLPPFTNEERQILKQMENKTKSLSEIPFQASELTRTVLDDFYQVPLKTLQEDLLDGDKTFFWQPIFRPIVKKPK